MAKSLLIIGAGGHGHVVAEIANACGYTYAFLDDNSPEAVGKLDQLQQLATSFDAFFVAIGNGFTRQTLLERLEDLQYFVPVLVHPTAYVAPSAKLGAGTVIAPGAVVNTRSNLGKGCIVSVGALIDHDARIDDFVHINAGAVCKAGSRVGALQRIDAGRVVEGF